MRKNICSVKKTAHTLQRNRGEWTIAGNYMEHSWPQKSVVVCTHRFDICHKFEDKRIRLSNPFIKSFYGPNIK